MNITQRNDSIKFLTALALGLLAASLWIFATYLHYMLVGAVLALATSHVFKALVSALGNSKVPVWVKKRRQAMAAVILTLIFLFMIFFPMLYFISVTYDQVSGMNLEQIKQTAIEMAQKTFDFLGGFPILKSPLERLQSEGMALIKGPGIEMLINATKGLVSGVGILFGQIVWILLFYPNGAKKFYRIILNKRQIGLQRIVGTNLQSPIGRVIKCKSDHRNTAGIRFLPKFS